MNRSQLCTVITAVALTATAAAAQVAQVDQAVPGYQRGTAVSGNLDAVGSDTMNNLMTYWGEAFARLYPTVRIQVEGKGPRPLPRR